MDPTEELGGFLDNDQFVSFRWLAIFLDITVEKSKRVLEDYKSSNSDVSATYCISGQLKNKHRCVTVVSEKNLARSKELFEIISYSHIYSLQKKKIADSSNLPMQLHAIDVQQAREQILMQDGTESFLLNLIGGVRLNGNEVKPIGKRATAPTRVIVSGRDPAPSAAQAGVMKAFTAANGKSKEKTGMATSASSSSSGKETSKEKLNERSKSVASAFFANSAATSDNTKAAISAKSEKASTASKKVTVSSTKSDYPDDNDEWTEDGAEIYKLDKNKLKNRGVDRSSSASSVDQSSVSTSVPIIMEKTSVTAATTDTRKAPVHVHGAMDDYMEDVAIEQYKLDQAAGVSEISEGAVVTSKHKKRKLVEKMFGDAKGYLITEMVWEDVTDDDEPQSFQTESRSSETASKVAAAKEKRPIDCEDEDEEKDGGDKKGKTIAKTAATKKAKKAAPATQQKGMMSFFGKK